jgi:hypothetical protein
MPVANCLTAGITVDCNTSCCSGGVNRIFLAKLEDIDTVTRAADDAISAITMQVGAVFYEIVPLEFTSNFNQSVTVENNNVTNDITLDFTIPCVDDTVRERLQEILNCCCGMAIIVELTSGYTIGVIAQTDGNLDLKFGKVKPRSMEFTSGAALSDPNQIIVTLGAFSNKLAVEFEPGTTGVPT